MINQQLVDYIKQQMQAGVSKDAVRKALGDAGWPPADVDDSLKATEPAGGTVSQSPAAQEAINPAVAMGGVDVAPSGATASSSSDKFFSKPAVTAAAQVSKSMNGDDHPAAKKFVVATIAMGIVIVLLAGALVFVYFNLNSQLDAAQTGVPGDSSQAISLQQKVNQLTTEKEGLAAQIQSLNADNQDILTELSMFASVGTASSTTPLSATVKGTLTGTASTTFALITAHNVKIVVANSKDAKVSAALAPLVESTSTVTLAGTHPAASLNLTVTSVNGTPL